MTNRAGRGKPKRTNECWIISQSTATAAKGRQCARRGRLFRTGESRRCCGCYVWRALKAPFAHMATSYRRQPYYPEVPHVEEGGVRIEHNLTTWLRLRAFATTPLIKPSISSILPPTTSRWQPSIHSPASKNQLGRSCSLDHEYRCMLSVPKLGRRIAFGSDVRGPDSDPCLGCRDV